MKNITATIANTHGLAKIRLRVSAPLENSYGHLVKDSEYKTGISLEAIYVGKKWFVLEFYSVWQGSTGTSYVAYEIGNQVNQDDILTVCERFGIEPPKKIEIFEA